MENNSSHFLSHNNRDRTECGIRLLPMVWREICWYPIHSDEVFSVGGQILMGTKDLRRAIDTLILDLDNTLFDWFEIWYANFQPVYARVVELCDGDAARAASLIRPIHQRSRTSEYSFLIDDLITSGALPETISSRDDFQDALEMARKGRDSQTSLYPTVFQSLWDIKKAGVKIVAYTESLGFYSAYRLKRLGLDGLIDVMFCPENHDTPEGVSLAQLRNRADDAYELQVTEVRHTPKGELKPNIKILREIIDVVGASIERCAYVGDNLFKDIVMAKEAHILDIHAKYGEVQQRSAYDLLKRVSHWPDSDVQREQNAPFIVKPTIVLNECFAEVFKYCSFQAFRLGSGIDAVPHSIESDKIKVDVWKKVVDVQQHFNDMGLRIRNCAITIVGALIAAIGVMSQKGLFINLFGTEIPMALSLVLAALLAWIAFFVMDRYWYHMLLKGAVDHAITVENELQSRYPEIALGESIAKRSQSVTVLGWKLDSTRRLNLFYGLGIVMLVFVGLGLFFGISKPDASAGLQTNASSLSDVVKPSP